MGHFHRRLIFSTRGSVEWDGNEPFVFDPAERYLIVAAPVCSGWCAMYDTNTDQLQSIACSADSS
jgi:hypothetical protein